MLEQHRAETTTLVVVTHDEGDLGLVRFCRDRPDSALRPGRRKDLCWGWRRCLGTTVVAGDRNELALDDGHERQPVLVVNGHKMRYLLVADIPARREEAEVHRLGRQLSPECSQGRAIGRPDGAQPGGTAVEEEDVTFELGRIRPGNGWAIARGGTDCVVGAHGR